MENLKTLKKIERHFRTLPRFGAFYARDTKFQGAKFQHFVHQPLKFERSILLRLGGDDRTKWPIKNHKIGHFSKLK